MCEELVVGFSRGDDAADYHCSEMGRLVMSGIEGGVKRTRERSKHTRKSLLHIDTLPRTRLHKPGSPPPRPLEPPPRTHLPQLLQIALVPRHELDRLQPARVLARFFLHGDQVGEVGEVVEGAGRGDVVDEEEGVGAQVGGCPEAAVFFLPRGVG